MDSLGHGTRTGGDLLLVLGGSQRNDLCGLRGSVIGLVVETQCRYFSELAFPQAVDLGLRIGRLGTSSVRYEIGVFAEGEPAASAQGHFIHVYVERATRRPTPLPAPLRAALEHIHS